MNEAVPCDTHRSLPEGWLVQPLQKLCREQITYGIVQCGPHIVGGIPYIRVSDMNEPEFDVTTMLCTTAAIAGRFSRSTVVEGDLVYALRGKLGEVRKVGSPVAGANLTQGTARLSPRADVASDYLLWAMRSPSVVRQAELVAKGSTFVELTLASLRQLEIPVPKSELEQRAIATALTDVDALIAGLERLIAKKRDIKQAAMQQLLTGQTRLPGFSGEWSRRRLGELAEMGSGGTPPAGNPNYYGGAIPWVAISDMTQGGKFIERTERSLSDSGLANSAAQLFPAGTVLYAMYASLGECSIACMELCTSQAILGIRPRTGLVRDFLYYSLTSRKEFVKTLGQQGTQSNLNKGIVQSFEIHLPPPKEQTAIATALSDMDADLSALESRLAKTRAIKQGMMQELLTGRTRLV